MGPGMDINNLFGGRIRHMDGVGAVMETGSNSAPAALGDEAAVMMISGVGQPPAGQLDAQPGPISGLSEPKTIFGVTLPLWQWLALAGAIGVVIWLYTQDKKGR